jgi:hypothetical protein
MKGGVISLLALLSVHAFAGDNFNCKTVKACSDWATDRTSVKYELGKFEKRSLNVDKDFSFTEGDPDFIFNYILQSNEMLRLKRESSTYQIISMRDMKDFQFPLVKAEEIPATLDFYSTEFTLSNKEKVKNAQIMIKKFISKNGRVLEVADAPKLQVIDTGISLNAIKLIITELNK